MSRIDDDDYVDDAKMEEKDRVLSHPITSSHVEGVLDNIRGVVYTNDINPYNYRTEQSKHEDWYFGYVNAIAIVKVLHERQKI